MSSKSLKICVFKMLFHNGAHFCVTHLHMEYYYVQPCLSALHIQCALYRTNLWAFGLLLTSLCHGCRRCLEDTVSVLLENIPAHQTPGNTRWLLFLEIRRKKKKSLWYWENLRSGLEMCKNIKCIAAKVPDASSSLKTLPLLKAARLLWSPNLNLHKRWYTTTYRSFNSSLLH